MSLVSYFMEWQIGSTILKNERKKALLSLNNFLRCYQSTRIILLGKSKRERLSSPGVISNCVWRYSEAQILTFQGLLKWVFFHFSPRRIPINCLLLWLATSGASRDNALGHRESSNSSEPGQLQGKILPGHSPPPPTAKKMQKGFEDSVNSHLL